MPVASMSTFNLETADQLAPRLRLFSVYEDMEAGLTAEWLSEEIRALVRNRCELLQDVWKLDLLAGFMRFREVTVDEASAADVVMLALKSLEQPAPTVCSWLETLKSRRANRTTPGLLLAILGTDEAEESQVGRSPMLDCLGHFARGAGLDFGWAAGDAYRLRDSTWLTRKLEPIVRRRLNSPLALVPSPGTADEEDEYDFDWVALP